MILRQVGYSLIQTKQTLVKVRLGITSDDDYLPSNSGLIGFACDLDDRGETTAAAGRGWRQLVGKGLDAISCRLGHFGQIYLTGTPNK